MASEFEESDFEDSDYDEVVSLMERAEALIGLGRAPEAVALLLQALAIAPDEHSILCSLSEAHAHADNTQEALEWADRAISADPEDAYGYHLRAIQLTNLGQHHAAIVAAQEGLRLAPDDPACMDSLASAQIYSGQMAVGAKNLERLFELAPDSYKPLQLAGLLAMNQKRWGEAEYLWRRVLELCPEYSTALTNLGVSISWQSNPWVPVVEVQRFPEAIDCLYRAAQTDPEDQGARSWLILVLRRYLLSNQVYYLTALTIVLLIPALVVLFFLLLLSGQDRLILLKLVAVPATVFWSLWGYCLTLRRLRIRRLPNPIRNYWNLRMTV